MRTMEDVKYEFTPQGKLDAGQTQRLLNLEVAFKEMALTVLEMAPALPARTLALNYLLMSKMLCSQAISHSGGQSPEPAAKEIPSEKKSNRKN